MNSRMRLVELSATLDGEICDGSNFSVKSKQMKSSEILSVLKERVDKERRVMVVVRQKTCRVAAEVVKRFPNKVISRRTAQTRRQGWYGVVDGLLKQLKLFFYQ